MLTPTSNQHAQNDQGSVNGTAVLNTPNGPDSDLMLADWSIAYTSCRDVDYQDGMISMSDVVKHAISDKVTAIVFYSTDTNFCSITDHAAYNGFENVYSMVQTKMNDSGHMFEMITGDMRENMARIYSATAYANEMNAMQSTIGSLGGSGSTAVAMIILYSITGVITALFLIIIVTGAVRAHRHPERYGPRNIMGRPRQSRAKGIARAMLDTIPIVKFGEQQPGKDVEQNGTQSHEMSPRAADGTTDHQQTTHTSTTEASSGDAIAPTTSETNQSDTAASATGITDENQGCSICTDDFERGQDIRVLPCNHQFHPACVDPWLLDVSGTCPLCRVDLNPSGSGDTSGDGNGEDLPPPLDPEGQDPAQPHVSRRRATLRAILMRGHNGPEVREGPAQGLQSADREERLAALRRWRQARRETQIQLQRHPPPESSENGTHTADASAATPEGTTDGTNAESVANADGDESTPQDDARRRSRLGRLSRLMRRG